MIELLSPARVRDRWFRTASQCVGWIDRQREQALRKDLYMPRDEIPYPSDGNFCEIVSVQGWTLSRTISLEGQHVFDQRYFNRIPSRLWFLTEDGVKFHWNNVQSGVQISAVYPDEKEDRTIVWPGGHCDRPDIFNWYKQAKRPIEQMMRSMAVVFIGIPAAATHADRRGSVQVITWPARADVPNFRAYAHGSESLTTLDNNK